MPSVLTGASGAGQKPADRKRPGPDTRAGNRHGEERWSRPGTGGPFYDDPVQHTACNPHEPGNSDKNKRLE